MNSAPFQSKVAILVPISIGALIGFLVWKTYFWVELPKWLIRSVINKESTSFLRSLSGSSEAAEHVLILFIYLLRSIPGALVFGLIAGALAAKADQGRKLVYSSLIWPIWLSVSSYVSLRAMAGFPGVEGIWIRRAEHQELQLVMYSAFLIVMFISSRHFGRGRIHDSSLDAAVSRRSA